MSEPSEWAINIAKQIVVSQHYDWPGDEVVARAIDQACAEKDKKIAEIRRQIGTDFMAGVVIEHEKRIAAARRLIERIGTTGVETSFIIKAAEKWLEGKP